MIAIKPQVYYHQQQNRTEVPQPKKHYIKDYILTNPLVAKTTINFREYDAPLMQTTLKILFENFTYNPVICSPKNFPCPSGACPIRASIADQSTSYQIQNKAFSKTFTGTATHMTGGALGFTVMITACPNDTTPVEVKCIKNATESARLDAYINLTNTSYCLLKPSTEYNYKVFHARKESLTETNCGPGTDSTCNFSATMSATP